MRRLIVFVALLSALAAAGQASAKEIQSAAVCGESGCEQGTQGSQLQWLAQVGDGAGPPGAAPFYTVKVVVAEPDGSQMILRSLYVPSEGKVGAKPNGSARVAWFEVLPQYADAVRLVAPQMKPFPASRFPAAPTSLSPGPAPSSGPGTRFPFLPLGLAALGLLAAAAFVLQRRTRMRHRPGRGDGLAPQP